MYQNSVVGSPVSTSFSRMEYQNPILDTKHDVATLTLNRPEKLNALDASLLNELIHAAREPHLAKFVESM